MLSIYKAFFALLPFMMAIITLVVGGFKNWKYTMHIMATCIALFLITTYLVCEKGM